MSVFDQNPYYHSTIKSFMVAFGELFTGIRVVKYNSDGTENKIISVPIKHGPKNKWLERDKVEDDFSNRVEITLPRLSFEVTDIRYSAERKIGTKGTFSIGNTSEGPAKIFNPVPYDIYINLYSITKVLDESWQITEQILPYFTPSMELRFKPIKGWNLVKNVPVILNGVNTVDNYDSGIDELRVVEQTFSFIAKLDLFGPIVQKHNIIKNVEVDITTNEQYATDPQNASVQDKYTASVNPQTAEATDDYTIDEKWELLNE